MKIEFERYLSEEELQQLKSAKEKGARIEISGEIEIESLNIKRGFLNDTASIVANSVGQLSVSWSEVKTINHKLKL
ncbi:MAG: hypothetical protein HRT70_05390 [Flavobacteriaceae bacterium]|nr:hypothetical protein [Flavobacteriaceae bacterium]